MIIKIFFCKKQPWGKAVEKLAVEELAVEKLPIGKLAVEKLAVWYIKNHCTMDF